jgi:NAD(P)-dependent dehydrogenase (short-subunit alcohol dehydrogenase family)
VVLHSIAFGNLKLVGPEAPRNDTARERLAKELGIDAAALGEAADQLFAEGCDGVQGLTTPPVYSAVSFLEEEDMALTIHAMGTSLLGWTQALRERGLFAPDARVLGLTSEGNSVAWKGYAGVAAAKVALESVSRSIAVEMAPFGIRSNIVQAGVTDTPALRMIPGSDHLKAQARIRNPFGRLTTPEDVADVIYLLSLPESAWINGAIIRVDGGERISGASR